MRRRDKDGASRGLGPKRISLAAIRPACQRKLQSTSKTTRLLTLEDAVSEVLSTCNDGACVPDDPEPDSNVVYAESRLALADFLG